MRLGMFLIGMGAGIFVGMLVLGVDRDRWRERTVQALADEGLCIRLLDDCQQQGITP